MIITTYKVSHNQKLSDTLLDPLRYCGEKWNEITDLGDSNIIYKALQVGTRIIPGSLLTIATGIAILPGLLGSLIRSYDPAFLTPWIPFVYSAPRIRSSMTVEIPMRFQTIQKCRNLGLNFIDKDALAYRLLNQLPHGMVSVKEATHCYTPGSNLSHYSFHLENSKHGKFHAISQCFHPKTTKEKGQLLLQFKNVILGLEPNQAKQAEIIAAVADIYRDVTVHVANDFSKMSLQAFV